MLSQADADALLEMPKRYEGPGMVALPPGADVRSEMVGIPHPEERFVLDLWRGRRNAAKIKIQTRGRHVFILARLDLHGAPHTNPDGQVIEGSHLHLYREGYGDKWAAPLDPSRFSDPDDLALTFSDFCAMCAIVHAPAMQVGML